MKRIQDRLLSFVMALLMMLNIVIPSSVFADDITYDTSYELTGEDYQFVLETKDKDGNLASPNLNGKKYHFMVELSHPVNEWYSIKKYYITENPIEFTNGQYVSKPLVSNEDFKDESGNISEQFDFSDFTISAIGLVEIEGSEVKYNAVNKRTSVVLTNEANTLTNAYRNIRATGKMEEVNEDHKLTLENTSFSTARDPELVMGDNYEYGIVAGTYSLSSHTETNFAVNKLLPNGAWVEVEGSGTGAIPFYVGSIENGQLQFGGNSRAYADVFVPDSYKNNSSEYINPVREGTKYTAYYIPQDKIDTKVSALIGNGLTISNGYRDAQVSVAPVLKGEEGILDLSSYPENATIIVDASKMSTIQEITDWKVKKYPGQNVVFNIPGESVTIKII